MTTFPVLYIISLYLIYFIPCSLYLLILLPFETTWMDMEDIILSGLYVFLSGKLLQIMFLLFSSRTHITGPLALTLQTALIHDFLFFFLFPLYFSLKSLSKKDYGSGGNFVPHNHSRPQLLLSTYSSIPRVCMESSTSGWQIGEKKGVKTGPSMITSAYILLARTKLTHLTERKAGKDSPAVFQEEKEVEPGKHTLSHSLPSMFP